MVKKIGYKTSSIIALTIAGAGISAHHADAAETQNTSEETPQNVLNDEVSLQQAESAKDEMSSSQQGIVYTQRYTDPSSVNVEETQMPTNTDETQAQDSETNFDETNTQENTQDFNVNETEATYSNNESETDNSAIPSNEIDSHNDAQVSEEEYNTPETPLAENNDTTSNTTNEDETQTTTETESTHSNEAQDTTISDAFYSANETTETQNNETNSTVEEANNSTQSFDATYSAENVEETDSQNTNAGDSVNNDYVNTTHDSETTNQESSLTTNDVNENTTNSNETVDAPSVQQTTEQNSTEQMQPANMTLPKTDEENARTTGSVNTEEAQATTREEETETADSIDMSANTSTFRSAVAPTPYSMTADEELPAYQPQVNSSINDYIRNQDYSVPTYEEDFTSYFPKYGYRNGVGNPEGIIVHDTANDSSNIDGEINFMKNNYQSAFVHGFIDGNRIIETQPTDYLAWGAGPIANDRFIHIELVHEHDYDSFARQMNNMADYAATNLQYYGLEPDSAENDGRGTVWTHNAVSQWLGGTDHADPHGYLNQHGYSYNELYDLINEKYQVKMGYASPANGTSSTSNTAGSTSNTAGGGGGGGSTTTSPSTSTSTTTSPTTSQLKVTNDTGVGRINSTNDGLYASVYDKTSKTTNLTDQTLSTSKKAKLGDQEFYLVSDYLTGKNIGWVKNSDVDYRTSTPATQIDKTYTIPGGTTLYKVPWGTSQQKAGKVSGSGAQIFKASQQRKVGNATYIYGKANDLSGWVNQSKLSEPSASTLVTQPVSEIGQVLPTTTGARTSVYDKEGKNAAKYSDKTYKISKEASLNNQNFVLLNDAKSPIGWFNADEVDINSLGKEEAVNQSYIVNTDNGGLYAIPWGTSQQRIDDLQDLSDPTFNATKQVKVGDMTYLFGNVNQKTGWINNKDLSPNDTKANDETIKLDDSTTLKTATTSEDADTLKDQDYFVTNKDGSYYDKPNGKILGSLANYYEQPFTIEKTLITDGITWYYGHFDDGFYAWLKASDLRQSIVHYYTSPFTLEESLDKQYDLNPKPQVQHTAGTWEDATREETRNAMDTTQIENDPTQKYQFLKLDQSQGLSADQLNKLLDNQGILAGQGEAFQTASAENNINEIYLISHALLETGNGTSQLSNGGYVDDNDNIVTDDDSKKFYNMFGIGAIDQDAVLNGFKTAEQYGWDSVSKAIIGGAQFIRDRYIDLGQNTLYRMRWNPSHPATHQYATDINWASHNATRLKGFYDAIGESGKYFDIDQYKI
ncbi:glucosaminidase domain-containing protein [Staphylococcus sp. 11262D007BW]